MTVVRFLWFGLAIVAAVLTARFAFDPIGDVAGSCSKGGSLNELGASENATCDDSIVDALGPARLVQLGLLVTTPPVVAGVAMRWWLSWATTAVLAWLAVVGAIGADGFWIGLLHIGVPATAGAVILATAQVAVVARRETYRRDRSTAGLNAILDRSH